MRASPEPGQPVVAAFDFDGTLTNGGSVWKFLVDVAGRPRVVAAGLSDIGKIARAAVSGGTANDVAKEALFVRVLAGADAARVCARAREFGLEHYAERARPEIRERLEWHKAKRHTVVIVSASPEIYLGGVAELLGADGVVATRLETRADGTLSGRFDGPNCRGHEKAKRLREWIGARSGPSSFVWAYGNSAGDREMLAGADVGIEVGRLGRFGKLRDFPRLSEVPA